MIALAPNENSGASSSVELKTVTTAPSVPSGVTVSPSSVAKGGSATLSWSASSNGTHNTLSGYRIDRSTDGSNWATLVSSQAGRTFSVTGQDANGASYYYRVIALAPYGNSAPSATVQLKTEWTAPGTPSGVVVSPSSVAKEGSATLSWSASAGGTNNPVTGYKVERSVNNTSWSTLVSSQTARTLAVTGHAANGSSYYYRVIALAPMANSGASASV